MLNSLKKCLNFLKVRLDHNDEENIPVRLFCAVLLGMG